MNISTIAPRTAARIASVFSELDSNRYHFRIGAGALILAQSERYKEWVYSTSYESGLTVWRSPDNESSVTVSRLGVIDVNSGQHIFTVSSFAKSVDLCWIVYIVVTESCDGWIARIATDTPYKFKIDALKSTPIGSKFDAVCYAHGWACAWMINHGHSLFNNLETLKWIIRNSDDDGLKSADL